MKRASLWFVPLMLAACLGCKKQAEEQSSLPADPAQRAAVTAAQAEDKANLAKSEQEISGKNYDAAVTDIMKVLSSPGLNDQSAAKAYELQVKVAEAAKTDPAAAEAVRIMRGMAKGR
jgi:hypothetical protein